ncbi:DEAD/DEAH box helicase [Peribacillus sp. SCS-155]|uniref:DEAD/DEAH box helicase n=1 Tax=Peribacillus sedimenti TaxID=3115297 RepID=UPI00390640C4
MRVLEKDLVSTESPIPSHPYSKELQKHLSGRSLLIEEIPFEQELVKEHLNHGMVAATAGVIQEKYGVRCLRCGNEKQAMFYSFPCARCGKSCTYCRSCIMLGRVSQCSRLYTWTGPEAVFDIPMNVMVWNGKLSAGQQTASDAVVQAVVADSELLVWAVCGSGKTEVLFKGIEAALFQDKRICIATPRTDVVLELTPRLKQAFPHIPVASLFGGSEDRHLFAPLTISTTHQLFRFQNAFDVIIIDEVDAFPYSMDTSLQYAVQKAKKKTSTTIYLTATPSKSMQNLYKSAKLAGVTIPARFHRHSIPVPQLKWCGNWEKQFKKKTIPPMVREWMKKRLEHEIPFLLFFPSIKIMESVLPLFRQLQSELQVVHSEDPERKEKVMVLREGKVPGLLTTTILERGVTIPKLDVAVIGSEHSIFSESALVQIAGRVGRNAAKPTGDVMFFHYGKSIEMIKAVSHIEGMNREARNRGLIDD